MLAASRAIAIVVVERNSFRSQSFSAGFIVGSEKRLEVDFDSAPKSSKPKSLSSSSVFSRLHDARPFITRLNDPTPPHTACSLLSLHSSFIQRLAAAAAFPNSTPQLAPYSSFAPVVNPAKRSLNASHPPPAPPPLRVNTVDPEHCTPNAEGMGFSERGTWCEGDQWWLTMREVCEQMCTSFGRTVQVEAVGGTSGGECGWV